MPFADVRKRGGDTVEKRLGADQSVVGRQIGAVGEVLARSEADFQVQRPVVAKQAAGGDFVVCGHRDLRELPQVRGDGERVPPADEESTGVVLAEEAGLLAVNTPLQRT